MLEDVPKKLKFDSAASKFKSLTSGGIRISLIIFFSVLTWRIAWSDFNLDFREFDFSDLLAMILALFAMGMSVAFYFKTTDSSNQFYDNTYKFTQKTSEILGRIEERFGERLRSLDEGYGRIQNKFDGITQDSTEIKNKVKEKEGEKEKEEEKVEKSSSKAKALVEDLAKRANMEENEKVEFLAKLQELEQEKERSMLRIHDLEANRNNLQKKLKMLEAGRIDDKEFPLEPILLHLINQTDMRNLVMESTSLKTIQKESRNYFSKLNEETIHNLYNAGILNHRREITSAGVTLLRSFLGHIG